MKRTAKLDFRECSTNILKTFPKNSFIDAEVCTHSDFIRENNGYLEITFLKNLPNQRLWIDGDLDLSRSDIKNLPDDIWVGGNLDLSSCRSLEKLPKDLEVGGYLFLSNSGIVAIDNDIYMNTDDELEYNYNSPDFRLDNSKKLERVRGISYYFGGMSFDNCTSLIKVSDITCTSELSFFGCTKLKSVENIYLEPSDGMDTINFSGCHELREFDGDMEIQGSLYLNDCHSLEQIPSKLSIGRDLHINGCKTLRELPEDLEVGGKIYIDTETGFYSDEGDYEKSVLNPELIECIVVVKK